MDLRIAGRNLDHLRQPYKWSFKVKLKGNRTLFGMRKFSLLVPDARAISVNPLTEWICHQIEKAEGLISLRYDFVRVTINGKYIGIYALEERFDKHLIEHNSLREGVLFRSSWSPLPNGFNRPASRPDSRAWWSSRWRCPQTRGDPRTPPSGPMSAASPNRLRSSWPRLPLYWVWRRGGCCCC